MLLYHFTCLVWLPEVIRDGITKGEVPTGPTPYADRPQAANLTANPNREDQHWNSENAFDKARIRLKVEVPESELTSFRQVKDRYKIKQSWLKLTAPYLVRQQWYFAFGGVRPDQIKLVEKWDNGKYSVVDNLPDLINQVEVERERALTFIVPASGIAKGAIDVRLKPGVETTWLLDGAIFQE